MVKLAQRGARDARRAGEAEVEGELELTAGAALAQLGQPEAALARLEAAGRADPTLLDVPLERGHALYELRRYQEARAAFDEVAGLDPEDDDGELAFPVACAEHGLGLVAERTGDRVGAERHFRRARALAPDDFPAPVRMSAAEVEAALEEALAELPPPVRQWLSNVAITLEEAPSDEDLAGTDPPLPPSILGLFRGAPLGDKASMDPWSHFPSSIAIYQRNLERAVRDRAELVEELRVTLLHEVGHFLGLDEDDLEARGLA